MSLSIWRHCEYLYHFFQWEESHVCWKGYCFLEISWNKFSKAMLRLKLEFCKSCLKPLLTKVDEKKKNWHKSVEMLISIKKSANFSNHYWGILKHLSRNGKGDEFLSNELLAILGSKLHVLFLIFKEILFLTYSFLSNVEIMLPKISKVHPSIYIFMPT